MGLDYSKVGHVYTCQPDYGHGHSASHRMFWTGALRKRDNGEFDSPLIGRVHLEQYSSSFNAGNIFIAGALNAQEAGLPLTHIAMLHNDVVPEQGWLDILMEELLRTGATLMSAVIPIKDLNGLSSTAIDSEENPFEVERRITMTEIYRLPETFGAEDCGYDGGRFPKRKLLVNTGCFIMDFTKDWRKELNPDGTLRLTMTSPDRIGRRTGTNGERNGQWEAQHSPSDWRFSRDVANFGGKVMATRKVRLVHMGELPFSNQQPWGEWEMDQALQHKFGGKPIMGPSGDSAVTEAITARV